MDTRAMSFFFAVLCLSCWAATVVLLGLAAARHRRPQSGAAALLEQITDNGRWLACMVVSVATAGSLYYSEVAHFTPCELCWYQRICMYPLSIILLVALVRRDRSPWAYVVPQALVGAVLAVYHTQLQAFPSQGTFCSSINPCTARYVWVFGFVSLPMMALSAFCFVLAMAFVARTRVPKEHDDLGDDASPPVHRVPIGAS